MNKLWKTLLLLLTICLTFTGCNVAFLNPEAGIHAPGATGIYAGVQEALEASVGQDIVLKYPMVHGVNTAFYPVDLNADGTEEMLAFYQKKAEGSVTRVNVIEYRDSEWRSVQDLEPFGGDVLDVDVCDLNGDGISEICIGWSVYTSPHNQMCVYQWDTSMLTRRAAESYTRYVVCDIDGDGFEELGLALLNSGASTSSLSFYEMEKDTLTVLGSLVLDSSVISYGKMVAAVVNEDTVGVYLDAYKAADVMITELIYLKNGKLYNPFASKKDAQNTATLRYCTLSCSDVNQDNVLEIPFMEELPGYTKESVDPTAHLVTWRYYNGNFSDTVATWWYNPSEKYYLELAAKWQHKFTVLYNGAGDCYEFYAWSGEKLGERQFALRNFTAAEYEKYADKYQMLYENNAEVWGVQIDVDNTLGVTAEQLKERFHLILQ